CQKTAPTRNRYPSSRSALWRGSTSDKDDRLRRRKSCRSSAPDLPLRLLFSERLRQVERSGCRPQRKRQRPRSNFQHVSSLDQRKERLQPSMTAVALVSPLALASVS